MGHGVRSQPQAAAARWWTSRYRLEAYGWWTQQGRRGGRQTASPTSMRPSSSASSASSATASAATAANAQARCTRVDERIWREQRLPYDGRAFPRQRGGNNSWGTHRGRAGLQLLLDDDVFWSGVDRFGPCDS